MSKRFSISGMKSVFGKVLPALLVAVGAFSGTADAACSGTLYFKAPPEWGSDVYVAFEQMVQGVPVIGSDSIPFATLNASYSSMPEMYDCMDELLKGKDKYRAYCMKSYRKATCFNENNILLARKAAERMVNRDA